MNRHEIENDVHLIELKECPFCGSRADIVESQIGEWYAVSCATYIENEDGDLVYCPGHTGALQHRTQKGAVLAWNVRSNFSDQEKSI